MSTLVVAGWAWRTATGAPGSGQVTSDTGDVNTLAVLRFSGTSASGRDMAELFPALVLGDFLRAETGTPAESHDWYVNGLATPNGATAWDVPVRAASTGAGWQQNETASFSFLREAASNGMPSLAEVRAWILVPVSSMSDVQLTQVMDAETDLQAQCCQIPATTEDYPPALAQALLRRVARHVSARGVPLGLTGDSEFGPVRLPSWDVEIERLEAPYRVIAVA